MPQTVWDYVAKLKTSVTKASNTYSISLFIMFNNFQIVSILYIISVFLPVRSYV